ncbi:MAG: hypothetical protein K2L61_02730, partial [Clostridia bacterium]|nr:hypothetical protein [Clostridia bacterium]
MSDNNSRPRGGPMGAPMGGPMGGRRMTGEKAKDFKGTSAKLMRYMRSDLVVIIIAFILAIGGVVATITVPDVLSGATDILVEGAMKKTVYNTVVPQLKFDDETLSMMESSPYCYMTIGEIRRILEGDSQDTEDSGMGSIASQVPEHIKQSLSALPKNGKIDNIRLGALAGASKSSHTVGEFFERLGIEAGDFLAQVPEAYRQQVLEVSFDEKPEIDFDAIAKIALKLV